MNLLGIWWKVVACLAFAGVNSIVRYVTGGSGASTNPLSPTVVTLYEYLFACSLMIPFSLYKFKGKLKSLGTKQPLKHGIRVIAAILGVICFYGALKEMPISQAVALQFTGPIFSVIGARFYLKERVGSYRALGILFGVLGAFLVTRPDISLTQGSSEYLGWTILLPVVSAILFVVSKLASRDLARSGERPEVLALYLLFFMIPSSLLFSMGQWVIPTLEQLFYLGALGLCGVVAHYATAKSFRYAEVIFLMPIGFSRLVFSAILAYILFDEFPKSEYAWPGMFLILLSVWAISYGEGRLKEQQKKQESEINGVRSKPQAA